MAVDQIISSLSNSSGDMVVGIALALVDILAEVFTNLLVYILERIL